MSESGGIIVLDEVERDGGEVSSILFNTFEDKDEVIKNLTREQKILFMKFAAKMEPDYFGCYADKSFIGYSDDDLNGMTKELDWMWK